MGFLKSSRNAADNNGVSLSDKVAKRIAGTYLTMKNRFANKMNRAVGSMSAKRQKAFLMLFCIVVGGYSGWLIIRSVALTPKGETVWHIEQIKRPESLEKAGDENATADVYVDEHTYVQTQFFKMYMDSLRSANMRLYDSVLTARPRLMGSVLALEKIYQLQNQK